MSSLVIKLIQKDPIEIFRLFVKVILFFLPSFRQEDVYYLRRGKMLHILTALGLYEASYLKALRSLVKPGDTVVDVGANFGVYTEKLSKLVGQSGHVFAFEPLSGAFSYLNKLKSELSNVTAFKVGISNVSGQQAEIHIPLLFGKIPEPALSTLGSIDSKVAVETISIQRLDDFNEQIKNTTFIKVDIEGLEREFFEGAMKLIERDRPVVQFEADKFKDLEKFLKDFSVNHNYVACHLDSQGNFIDLKKSETAQNLYLFPKEKR